MPEEDQTKSKNPVSSSYRDFIESTLVTVAKDALPAALKHNANDMAETSFYESNPVTLSLPLIRTSHC